MARFALAALGLSLLWSLTPSASAAIPSHARNPALDVVGLNHACGLAVDSKSDFYASSAGAAKILVFGPSDHETPIGEIANANEPCGLAVTTTGVLYVSEAKTGEVVRYKPTIFPFVGAPSYGPREVIDSSGEARGISVDPFDDRLYVAEGTRVSAYDSAGNLGAKEVQEVNCFLCTGGKYELEFEGQLTKEINFEGPASEVKEALEGLASIDLGDVSVVNEDTERRHVVTFEGKYAHKDVPSLVCIDLSLSGSGHVCEVDERSKGWDGHIGEGGFSQVTGVAAYTYKANGEKRTYHLAVADASSDQVELFSSSSFKEQKPRRTLDGAAEGEEFGFGAQGAYLGADPGTCPPAGQACTAGHFLLYDDAHQVLDEFEADGELVSQTPFAFGEGAPTATAVDRSGGAGNGALYVTSGSGPGAEALAFSPLGEPSRPGPLSEQSLTLAKTCSVAVDSFGDRYVAVGPEVFVYPPTGSKPLAKITEGSGTLCRVAVDSEGNLYALLKEKVAYFKPSSFPPLEGMTYGAAVTVAKQSELGTPINALAIDPANDHLLANSAGKTIEYASAKEGSGVLNPSFAASLNGVREAVAACAKTGNRYVALNGSVYVLNAAGTQVLTQITGVGSPLGTLAPHVHGLAVDQSDCHVLAFEPDFKAIEEFEDSGTYLASFGSFTPLVTTDFGLAVDNGASSPNEGDVYLAYDDPGALDLSAFGGLGYPKKPPLAKYLLTVKKTGGGSGTVISSPAGIDCGATCSAEFEEGTKVTLTATAAEGSEFKGWSGCDSEPEGRCRVAMTKAREVTASFEKAEEPGVPLTVSLEGSGSGTVTSSPGLVSCEPFCSDEFEAGAVVTLTASPAADSLFVAWKHCDSGGVEGRQCTVTMNQATQVQAVFVTAHLLTVAKAEGSGPGKVSSYGGLNCAYACTQTSALVKEGAAVTVKETPAKHFHLAGWSGDCTGTGACELTMGEDHEVIADFEEDPKFSLSLAKSGGGQALIKTKPAGVVCGYACTAAEASFYEGEAVQVSWKLNRGTTKLTWIEGAGTCTGSTEALEGSCAVTMAAAGELVASLE